MKIKKNILTVAVLAAAIGGMLMSTASMAGYWHHHHYWRHHHWQLTMRHVRYRGCRKIIVERFCHYGRFGVRCMRVRRVHDICY